MLSGGPIFIIGSPRSGTSLLSRMISSHPQIGIPFESHLYSKLYSWRKCYGSLDKLENKKRLINDMINLNTVKRWEQIPSREDVIERFCGDNFHSAFRALMDAWLSMTEKNRWGEKTPHNVFFCKMISKHLSDSRFIHIVRDGRDVAMSWKRVRFGPEHFYSIAKLWNRYIEEVENQKLKIEDDRFFEVKYEEVISSPEETLMEICDFLDEKFSPRMMSFHEDPRSYPTDKRNDRNLSRPLLRNNMNKWKSGMDSRNLRIFETVSGGVLERYNYERGCKNANLSKREDWQMRYVECPITRFLGFFKDVQGIREAFCSLPLYIRLTIDCYLGVGK